MLPNEMLAIRLWTVFNGNITYRHLHRAVRSSRQTCGLFLFDDAVSQPVHNGLCVPFEQGLQVSEEQRDKSYG